MGPALRLGFPRRIGPRQARDVGTQRRDFGTQWHRRQYTSATTGNTCMFSLFRAIRNTRVCYERCRIEDAWVQQLEMLVLLNRLIPRPHLHTPHMLALPRHACRTSRWLPTAVFLAMFDAVWPRSRGSKFLVRGACVSRNTLVQTAKAPGRSHTAPNGAGSGSI